MQSETSKRWFRRLETKVWNIKKVHRYIFTGWLFQSLHCRTKHDKVCHSYLVSCCTLATNNCCAPGQQLLHIGHQQLLCSRTAVVAHWPPTIAVLQDSNCCTLATNNCCAPGQQLLHIGHQQLLCSRTAIVAHWPPTIAVLQDSNCCTLATNNCCAPGQQLCTLATNNCCAPGQQLLHIGHQVLLCSRTAIVAHWPPTIAVLQDSNCCTLATNNCCAPGQQI